MEGVSDTVVEEVGECVMHWKGKWWERRKELLYSELMTDFGPLPSLTLSGHSTCTFSVLIFRL